MYCPLEDTWFLSLLLSVQLAVTAAVYTEKLKHKI